jgi:hypothetical protein
MWAKVTQVSSMVYVPRVILRSDQNVLIIQVKQISTFCKVGFVLIHFTKDLRLRSARNFKELF